MHSYKHGYFNSFVLLLQSTHTQKKIITRKLKCATRKCKSAIPLLEGGRGEGSAGKLSGKLSTGFNLKINIFKLSYFVFY